MTTWTVCMSARHQTIFTIVDVEAENMAEAKEKALEAAREASWDAEAPAYKSDISVDEVESK